MAISEFCPSPELLPFQLPSNLLRKELLGRSEELSELRSGLAGMKWLALH